MVPPTKARAKPGNRRCAGGLVRTLVVASATLAILLVCFSIYSTQFDTTLSEKTPEPRLPAPPGRLEPVDEDTIPADSPGVRLQQGVIGPARNITVTIYPPTGKRAALEITVSDWTPKDGSDHEFLLDNPEVRMRTNDGNDVRVTARRGVLEASRQSGGGLDPRRGALSGDVVIEFDRRTDEVRATLPPESRDEVDPAEIVRVEVDELEFDLEYDKLIVPGPLHLHARDVDFQANGVEIRFNEAQSRVESMRISRGGRIEMFDPDPELGLAMPGIDLEGARRVTLVDWIRASIESRVDLQAPAVAEARAEGDSAPADPEQVAEDAAATTEVDAVPVFRAGDNDEDTTPKPVVHYLARFEDNVDARQQVGGETRSRLQADSLEVLRDFADRDEARIRSTTPPGANGAMARSDAAEPVLQPQAVVLEWTGRLMVTALSQGDERRGEEGRSMISATGSPARLTHPDGSAACTRLTYDPDGSDIRLFGSMASPVLVQTNNQGSMTGVQVNVRRTGDKLFIEVEGPGSVVGDIAGAGGAAVQLSSGEDLAASPGHGAGHSQEQTDFPSVPVVEFSDSLAAFGRVEKRVIPDLSAGVTSTETRLLDRVTFSGDVRMRRDDMAFDADALTLFLGSRRSLLGFRQILERIEGRGDVVLGRHNDRLACNHIDVDLITDEEGQSLPATATALYEVVAVQGERTLRAKDSLIIDFERAGGDVAPESDHAVSPARTRAVVSRLRAQGEVTVFDPSQPLDLSAETLDCAVVYGREIDRATVIGTEDRPATVRLDTFGVSGREVRMRALEQSAEVPGPGRMTLQSSRDLDGRKTRKPIPIVVTWSEGMTYKGEENRAMFSGDVHATSEASTTFDGDELLVEFADAVASASEAEATRSWGIFEPFIKSFSRRDRRRAEESRIAGGRFNKEITAVFATGHAVVETAAQDPVTGAIESRVRLCGPKLSVDLRSEMARMLIEGAGSLQLEDFRPADPARLQSAETSGDLFGASEDAGPSKTLIEWGGRMVYDYSIDQTRFEEDVKLKHFSGAELERILGVVAIGSSTPPGRRTFLDCDDLSVDFLARSARPPARGARRIGRLSSERLQQFHASGSVVLQDITEGLWLSAQDVIYERGRKILAIYGSRSNKARIVKQEKDRLPTQLAVEQLVYNLTTGKPELKAADVKGR